jgi:hypothetical protein
MHGRQAKLVSEIQQNIGMAGSNRALRAGRLAA